jgi:DNA-binding NarL/FixJ family response regulator
MSLTGNTGVDDATCRSALAHTGAAHVLAARPGGVVTGPTRPTRLVIVDDHVLMRQGLRALLQSVPEVAVVAESGTTGEAVAAVAGARPDVVVLDIRLGATEEEGIELCRRLSGWSPVLVLTTSLTESLMLDALRAGACGILVKDSDFASLVRAIIDVRSGRSAFDSRTAAVAARLLTRTRNAPRFTLRERDILWLIARGLSNRAIGGRLYISETTVKFHVANLMRKTGASSRTEAVFKASRLGLI